MSKEQPSVWRIPFKQNIRGEIKREFTERFGIAGEVEERRRILEHKWVDHQHNRRFEVEVQTVTEGLDEMILGERKQLQPNLQWHQPGQRHARQRNQKRN